MDEGTPTETSTSDDTTASPPHKKARCSSGGQNVDSSTTVRQEPSSPSAETRTSPSKKPARAKKKAATKTTKPTLTSKPKKGKGSRGKTAPDTKSMRWTVPLTRLALETRFKNPRILKKIAKKTSDTKKIRATWEDTVTVFLERALIEGAWGDGEEGRDVSVSQFKNKLNAIRKAYRAKRTRMLATGNRAMDTFSGGEGDSDEGSRGGRSHPELPSNYLLDSDEAVDDAGRIRLTCDPLNVRPKYRKELGDELAALWSLLCDIFSSKPGLTGEAIIESGPNASDSDEHVDDASSDSEVNSDDECSDTPSEARERAKAAAKAKKQKQAQAQQQHASVESKRPVELLNDTLRDGFTTFGRIFESRLSSQIDPNMALLVENLTSAISASNAQQQESSQTICQGIASLQQTTVGLFTEMMKQLKGPNAA
ncbi:hypothetical protein PHYSODRAFT_324085 [Phytophthora sojae]|uniref:Uncharacterized protein n=1 Tax=Phytophthora sojae (strain P6497) TaxID=1094619 RepID=G4Z0T6_PHYSP|nr:hypothetical protein PHYSODRAFT_324085 [Phytophthora sojae]EGZ22775.1 hypothetical protein PHYSODRAFT_324085 [Phytophthora sojae]|eukprot:XP_009518063.1 hypothetical protein PHYSODRAFT_324085 [Phytophthora sojae]